MNDKALEVYLIMYPGSADAPTDQRHYTIIIDVRAESNKEMTTGLELHLVVPNSENQVVGFKCAYRTRPSDSFPRVPLGRLTKPLPMVSSNMTLPDFLRYPCLFISWGPEVFEAFLMESVGRRDNVRWGADTNCQKFARYHVTALQLPWPANVPVISDHYNWAIEWYVAAN
ncbi:hypothetical protein SAMD00019534_056980 [Acytostelium subglobosum LB1]|uniref:hypothetical protein n=1 Tax=Acytostelium subglobosum LB1 TaxID=1410327 RepID=UPI0006451D09|nr:hypothetical protein SAMD00019534_056980 [Acytostelium subglobosum LB1]GAM22523.1 hypothetical protein SAMD00019534_056980 [Acytostelium subglobosum LB1]|eukprot:XP_012754643.1 hypothetical protein SAMD00019534_056980 [Acytostelium subglobosum LB1]